MHIHRRNVFYRYTSLILGAILVGVFAWQLGRTGAKQDPAKSISGGQTILNETLVENGYLLYSPFTAKNNNKEPGTVYLTDLHGNIVHTWKTTYSTLYAEALPDGSIYAAQILPQDLTKAPGGGMTGLIEKIDMDNNVLWSFKDPLMHHDFAIDAANESIYAIRSTPLTLQQTSLIQGGKKSDKKTYWADEIIQIDTQGKIVWKWNMSEKLNISDYDLDSITPQDEWSHSNTVKFYTDNPISHSPALLFSSRHLNTVFLIERETGKVLWQTPSGSVSYQHDPSLTNSGTILIFDNGFTHDHGRPGLNSSIVEIDPISNKIVRRIYNGSTGPERAAFGDSIMSGAQKLSNGNILGIDSLRGHIFEIDSKNNMVFSYVNPYTSPGGTGFLPNNIIFKARKISNTFFDEQVIKHSGFAF